MRPHSEGDTPWNCIPPPGLAVIACYFFAWGPLIEFGLQLPLREGMTLAAGLTLLGLFVLDWQLKRRMSANPGDPNNPVSPAQESMATQTA